MTEAAETAKIARLLAELQRVEAERDEARDKAALQHRIMLRDATEIGTLRQALAHVRDIEGAAAEACTSGADPVYQRAVEVVAIVDAVLPPSEEVADDA